MIPSTLYRPVYAVPNTVAHLLPLGGRVPLCGYATYMAWRDDVERTLPVCSACKKEAAR
jgi:hypothetical protein